MGKYDSAEQLAPASEPVTAIPLYADRVQVYPQAVRGGVRRVKWAVLTLCLAFYYLVPWLRWDRGPRLPDQAVLADFANGRMFFLWLEIWPQDIHYLVGLLVMGAVALFAVSALFGRLWCGFSCPQTVWTDLFMLVERWIEGDRNARMRRDRQVRWSWADRGRKAAKHAVWLLISAATGGAFVMYFTDAPTLVQDTARGDISATVACFFAIFTATTYTLAGWAREQVCTYMCPWPRFQAVMQDDSSLVVSYRGWRGEPRGKAKSSDAGDCVDCRACVNVCPTGIDIRDGLQLECIGCGLCIDACDTIMGKLDRQKGLIAFETLANLAASEAAAKALPPGPERLACGMAARKPVRFLRPQTYLYAGALGLVAAVTLGAYALRDTLTLSVIQDRAPLFVRLSDGGVRNAYTLKVVNKVQAAEDLTLLLDGPAGLQLTIPNAPTDADGRRLLTVRPDAVSQWRVLITAPPGLRLPDSTPIVFRLLDRRGQSVETQRSVFHRPRE